MEYIEVTKEAFNKLVKHEDDPNMIESRELFRKQYYAAHGVQLMIINNYVSNVTQYYIRDINA